MTKFGLGTVSAHTRYNILEVSLGMGRTGKDSFLLFLLPTDWITNVMPGGQAATLYHEVETILKKMEQ